MLVLNEVHSYYGDSYILQGVSLHVDSEEVVSIVGRNGAGKSTTINTIVGFVPPRRGTIRFGETDITHQSAHVTASMGIGLVPQGRRLFPNLTVLENITLAARATDARNQWTVDRIYQLFPILAERAHYRASQLSGGEQQMVAIARALLTNPTLVLMDEPSEGLAPMLVREIGRVLQELKAEGLSILLVEQNLPLATHVADRMYVMNKGRIVFEGRPDELAQNSPVKQRYLGV